MSAGRVAAALAALCLTSPLVLAGQNIALYRDFHGVWTVSGAHCHWPDEFLLTFGPRETTTPFRGTNEPDRQCRIVSAAWRQGAWRLRLSCNHPDPVYRRAKLFTVRQTLRVADDGGRMTIVTGPVLASPARTEHAIFCRKMGENPPLPKCMAEDGRLIDCPP